MTIQVETLPRKRAEAAALGLTHYFTGKPCKNGHIAAKFTSTGHCVECLAAYKKANPEKVRQYRKNSKEDPVKRRENRKRYRAKNSVKIAESFADWSARNKDRCRQKDREWRARNPDKVSFYSRTRRALRKNATVESLPVTLAVEEERKALTDGCCFCGSDAPKTLEHMVALEAGGLHIPSNLLGSCNSCNSSKGARPVEEWYRKQPFFSEQRWQLIQELTNG